MTEFRKITTESATASLTRALQKMGEDYDVGDWADQFFASHADAEHLEEALLYSAHMAVKSRSPSALRTSLWGAVLCGYYLALDHGDPEAGA